MNADCVYRLAEKGLEMMVQKQEERVEEINADDESSEVSSEQSENHDSQESFFKRKAYSSVSMSEEEDAEEEAEEEELDMDYDGEIGDGEKFKK